MNANDWEELEDFSGRKPLEVALVNGVAVQPGDQVRLQPRGNADAFDMLLRGHIATVESIEQDFEERIYLAVTVDDDPGKDLGQMRQAAHRFFFSPEDVETLPKQTDASATL